MAIDFYYSPLSPPCRMVLLLAKAIGVHFNMIIVKIFEGEHLKPDFLKMNSQHVIPTINDNGFILWESRAIMAYLIRKYAKNDALYPKDPKLKAIVDHRMYFDLNYLYGTLVDVYFPVMFSNVTEISAQSLNQLEKVYGILDKYLEDSTFIAGSNLTIADFSAIVSVSQTYAFGFDINRYDNVASWYKRCQERMEKYGFEDQIVQKGNELGAIIREKLQI